MDVAPWTTVCGATSGWVDGYLWVGVDIAPGSANKQSKQKHE